MTITYAPTVRGFAAFVFGDKDGSTCSIQQSSSATEDAIWLGVDTLSDGGAAVPVRMHLTREQVADLLPHLQHFVDTGELKTP